MKKFLHSRLFKVLIALALIAIFIIFVARPVKDSKSDMTTEVVSRGEIENIVSVSGIIEADNTADLAFPVTGKVATVSVREGDVVEEGAVLVSLEQSDLFAERKTALAALLIAEANRDELVNGSSLEERAVTETNVQIAEKNLERTIAEQNEKEKNAKRALFSASLEAMPEKSSNSDIPPTVSGTYMCEEGVYNISIFSSNSSSGYSYRLSGLEDGTYTAYTQSSSPFGSCGLSIQFDETENYSHSEWLIEIPNTRSASYATNLNSYNLALQQKENSISAAEQALELAQNQRSLDNTAPRDEALRRAEANIIKAESSLAVIDSRIKDHTLTAPFSGTVTSLDILPGETVTSIPVVTLLAEDMFEVTVRIPEIDITKINVGQSAELLFDARIDEIINSNIVLISPSATEIDGVAYFEAKIRIDEPPSWIRSGLNADVDILIDSKNDALKLPKRFITNIDGDASVLIFKDGEITETPVEIGFVGNDGFAEIIGLNEGATVIAP